MTNFTPQITANSLIYWCTNTCGNLTHNITNNDNFLIHSLAAWNNNWSRFQGRTKKNFICWLIITKPQPRLHSRDTSLFRDIYLGLKGVSHCRINTTSRRGWGGGGGNKTARDFPWFYYFSIFLWMSPGAKFIIARGNPQPLPLNGSPGVAWVEVLLYNESLTMRSWRIDWFRGWLFITCDGVGGGGYFARGPFSKSWWVSGVALELTPKAQVLEGQGI